jgi:hypothetical protein
MHIATQLEALKLYGITMRLTLDGKHPNNTRFKLGSFKRFEEKWFWSLCDTTKTT